METPLPVPDRDKRPTPRSAAFAKRYNQHMTMDLVRTDEKVQEKIDSLHDRILRLSEAEIDRVDEFVKNLEGGSH